jgi:riboflavin synthase
MFTGLVEEIGIITSLNRQGNGMRLSVKCSKILDDLKIDDSVSINGACQTVVKIENNVFSVDSIEETLRKTTLGKLRVGEEVNLERAMSLKDRFGGHIVQGHVDCVGSVISIKNETLGTNYHISYPREFSKYIVNTGSITINGISLTTSTINDEYFVVSLIPHTIQSTNIKNLSIGAEVNLEFDILGKYIERLMNVQKVQTTKQNFWNQFIDQPEM